MLASLPPELRLIGGLAVMCRVGTPHRTTVDVDAVARDLPSVHAALAEGLEAEERRSIPRARAEVRMVLQDLLEASRDLGPELFPHRVDQPRRPGRAVQQLESDRIREHADQRSLGRRSNEYVMRPWSHTSPLW